MPIRLQGSSLRKVSLKGDTNIYELGSDGLLNRYFIISDPGSRKLLSTPEVVGFDCYKALVAPTAAAIRYLEEIGKGGGFDILTILRGGLNYPLEEAAAINGTRVRDMHFLSCERIIKDHVITGLEIKYEKIRPTTGRTLAIGDIIASGATMELCLDYIVKAFRDGGGSLRRILFFTIGGTRAMDIMEELTPKIREIFPGFEGFFCFFYEGMFTVYDGPGASGINVRDIDFGWNGGVVSPEFRRHTVMAHPDSLLEKCIIYDGGARRYEIPLHLDEVADYWKGILVRASIIDTRALVGEKLGYPEPLAYEAWKAHTLNPGDKDRDLWEAETQMLRRAGVMDLAALAEKRLESIENLKQLYI